MDLHYDVFVSYAREDLDFVRRLEAALKIAGRGVWVDLEGLYAGEEFWPRICAAIHEADNFLFVISPASCQSPSCRREIEQAVADRKRIVPIVRVEVADGIAPPAIAARQWRFAREVDDFPAAVRGLIEALAVDVEWVRAHTRLLVRALEWDQKSRSGSLTLRGRELVEAEKLLALAPDQKEPKPTPLMTEYVLASRQAATRRQRLALSVALIVVALVAFFYQRARLRSAEAQRQTRTATAQRLANAARTTFTSFPQRAVLLAVEATQATKSDGLWLPAAHQVLRAALDNCPGYGLAGHTAAVIAAAATPDSRSLITGSWDGTFRVWDLTAPDPAHAVTVYPAEQTEIRAIVISEDNQWMVTGGNDGTIRVWDLRGTDALQTTGTTAVKATSIFFKAHEKGVSALALSADRHWLLTAGDDGHTWLWDLKASDPASRRSELRGAGLDARAVAISRDNRWAVTVVQGTAHLWRLTTKYPGDDEIDLPLGTATKAVAFSHDSRWLVTGGQDNVARLWDLTRKDPTKHPVELPGSDTGSLSGMVLVALSPDAHWLVSARETGPADLRLLDDKGEEQWAGEMSGHSGAITAVAFSDDSSWAVTGGEDATVLLWDLFNYESGPKTVLHGPEGPVRSLSISRDNRWVVTGSDDGTARLWRLPAWHPHSVVEFGIAPTDVSADSRWVATADPDGAVELWDLSTDLPAETPLVLHAPQEAARLAISPKGQWLATAGYHGAARLWNLKARDIGASGVALGGFEGDAMNLTISADDHWLVVGGRGTARVWDLTAKDPAQTSTVLDHPGDVTMVPISPDGRWLVTGSDRGPAKLWDLTATPIQTRVQLQPDANGAVWPLSTSPDSRWLLTADYDCTAKLWDLAAQDVARSAQRLQICEHASFASDISRDSRWLATGGEDGTLRLWKLGADAAKTAITLPGHEGAIVRVLFAPTSARLASAGVDGTVRLWDVTAGDPGRSTLVLHAHDGAVQAVDMTADDHLITAGDDGEVRLWDLTAKEPAQTVVSLGHHSRVVGAQLSRDNRWLVTVGNNGTVKLWDFERASLLQQARRAAGRNLSVAEWNEYFPGEPYRATFADLAMPPQ